MDLVSEYPEHEKVKAIQDVSQRFGEFLDWLSAEGYVICEWRGESKARQRLKINQETGEPYYEYAEREELLPVHRSPQEWLALFFDIDLAKLNDEKDVMYRTLSQQPRP